ncbi:MAG: lytic transglycosylase domain-containing protein [Bacteroidales bacterium]|nr:lytic transglycosylase domain-containing protein [Bacteroidales bacterium]
MTAIKKILVAVLILSPASLPAQTLFQPEELHKQAPRVPSYAVFAGDTMRFNRSDLYEGMDRELLSFTYLHTTSVLMLKRAPRYFEQVVPILKEMGVPEDFKYLMVIESNLDPAAVSSANAAGLWQFTKGTAQKYGLQVDAEVDERYNIEKETRAACQYFLEAKEKFDDWFTVAASYNCGTNGIARRMEAQRQTAAIDMLIPTETFRYIFRLLAVKMMFEKPEAFGFHVEPGDRYYYERPAREVKVSGPIPSLVDFAEEYGVTYAQLKRANLWLRSDSLANKNGKTYSIAIPKAY